MNPGRFKDLAWQVIEFVLEGLHDVAVGPTRWVGDQAGEDVEHAGGVIAGHRVHRATTRPPAARPPSHA